MDNTPVRLRSGSSKPVEEIHIGNEPRSEIATEIDQGNKYKWPSSLLTSPSTLSRPLNTLNAFSSCGSAFHLESQAKNTCGISSRWWTGAAKEALSTSDNLNDVKLVCEFVLDPDSARKLLSSMSTVWRVATLDIVVAELERMKEKKLSRVPDWKWLPAAISSDTDAAAIAERLDSEVQSSYGAITFQCLVRHVLWPKVNFVDVVDVVSTFLDGWTKFRQDLAQHLALQESIEAKWVALMEALELRHPTAKWIISSCVCPYDGVPDASDTLSFIVKPIRDLFERRDQGLILQLKKLKILATRVENSTLNQFGVCVPYIRWETPALVDFSFFEEIKRNDLEVLAMTMTKTTYNHVVDFSIGDFLKPGQSNHMRELRGHGGRVYYETRSCMFASPDLLYPLLRLAENLVRLGNFYCASAIGMALNEYQPDDRSVFYSVIMKDPSDTDQRFYKENTATPFLSPYISNPQRLNNAHEDMAEALLWVSFIEQMREVGAGHGTSFTLNKVVESPAVTNNSVPKSKKRKTQLSTGTKGTPPPKRTAEGDTWVAINDPLNYKKNARPIPDDLATMIPPTTPGISQCKATTKDVEEAGGSDAKKYSLEYIQALKKYRL